MRDATQKIELLVLPAAAGARRPLSRCRVCWLIFLIFALCIPIAGQAADPYAAVLDNYFAAEGEDSNGQTPNLTEAEWKVVDLESALKVETQKMAEGPPVVAPLPISQNRNGLLLAFALLLIAGLAFRKAVDLLNTRFNPWAASVAMSASSVLKIRAEEEGFSEFLLAFKTGPTTLSGDSSVAAGCSAASEPLRMFFARAPELLRTLRKLLQEIGRAANEASRQGLLADLHRGIREMKGGAGLSELLPVWQMAAAVEGLVKQLTNKAGNVNPSTLRTVAGAVDLLDELCKPGVRADLLTNPPIRILAVDDDIISRKAVSLALKKALNPPDLAENGESALVLAAEHPYDVIFLDVQMPGMDGFELCSKIHETAPNRATPVVFVTNQSDFDARAQSVLSGGSDLMAKPFLTFEITVKALTLILQGRLHGHAQAAGVSIGTNGHKTPSPGPAKSKAEASVEKPSADSPSPVQNPLLRVTRDFDKPPLDSDWACVVTPPLSPPDATTPTGNQTPMSDEPLPKELVQAFLARASEHLGAMRDLVQVVFQTADKNAQIELVADLYLRLHALAPNAGSIGGHPAIRMISSLEGLLKKLLENPKHCTSSTLLTVSTAVDFLNELCMSEAVADLDTNPPIRMLVVDDDPVARRAITCALQMAFEKPESAEDGEAALAAATERSFDLIFLDVQMPGMDGFTACSRIQETAQNRSTPVVFVTGQSDLKARTQATLSGGGDLIAKPFLTAEVTVKALTFALRGRLQKRKTGSDPILQSELRRSESFSSEAPPERPRPNKKTEDRRSRREEMRREELVSRRSSVQELPGKLRRFHRG